METSQKSQTSPLCKSRPLNLLSVCLQWHHWHFTQTSLFSRLHSVCCHWKVTVQRKSLYLRILWQEVDLVLFQFDSATLRQTPPYTHSSVNKADTKFMSPFVATFVNAVANACCHSINWTHATLPLPVFHTGHIRGIDESGVILITGPTD